MFDSIKNALFNRNRYRGDNEAVIVACFYNPQNNPYRLLAFQKWYHSIKHLPHRICEVLIGPDAKKQLPDSPYIIQGHADSLLWHKETLLNNLIRELPAKFKYVFWLDADVLFTNKNWLVDSVNAMRSGANIVQPFEYCIHLERNQLAPNFDVEAARLKAGETNQAAGWMKRMWRSFCANCVNNLVAATDRDYDTHGHVGFAWGAKREILDQCPLYDRALIGGADHIVAHAAAGHIPCGCITNGFADNIQEVEAWSKRFFDLVRGDLYGRIGYATGDLYHIWHGDIKDRKYLKRIKDFDGETKRINERDANNLHKATPQQQQRFNRHYREREVQEIYYDDFGDMGIGFYEDMGYAIADILTNFSQPSYQQLAEDERPNYAQDYQPNEQVPFKMGGAGIQDDGRHVIPDSALEGAVVSGGGAGEFAGGGDGGGTDFKEDPALEAAIHSAAQEDFTPVESVPAPAPSDPDNGNFS